VVGNLADRYRGHRSLAAACAALCAVSLWLFPLAASSLQPLLGLANGAGFAGAVLAGLSVFAAKVLWTRGRS